MDEKKVPENISYYAHEEEVMRHEKGKKRLWGALIVAILCLFASNMIWLYAWMSYDYVSEVTVDGKDGIANYLGRDGDIHNGESASQTDKN